MLQLPHFILIASEQQNVGQNDLACNIISRFYRENDIYGLKIEIDSQNNEEAETAPITRQNFKIIEEISLKGKNDTSRMLQAGAVKSFTLHTSPQDIEPTMESFLKMLPEKALVVFQANNLHDQIKPGVLLAIRQLYCKVCAIDQDDIFSKADRIVTYTVNSFDFSMDDLSINNGIWELKKH